MELKGIYEKLILAKRPIDFFGEISNEIDLKKKYRNYAKEVHPDYFGKDDEYIAKEATSKLNELYDLAVKEFKKGIYNVVDPLELFKHSDPLFEIDIAGNIHKFYEHVFSGDIANVFKGECEGKITYLKIARDSQDNELIDNEFQILSKIKHQSLPFIKNKIMINDTLAITTEEVEGIPVTQFMKDFKRGIPSEHVMWMLERVLSVTGYLHSNFIVHGNIKPENIIINKKNHNVSLLGFAFSIQEANSENTKYKFKNEHYSAPEVRKDMKVLPSSDIYSIGKIAITLLGGDVEKCAMPITVHSDIRNFIRKLIVQDYNKRPNDAWQLWDELREIRSKVFGNERFKTF